MLKTAFRADFTHLRACFQKRFYDQKPMPTPHTTSKPHDLDVQAAASKSGMDERRKSQEAGKMSGKKQDLEKEFPEAPRPIIGMQDERGRSKFSCVGVFWRTV